MWCSSQLAIATNRLLKNVVLNENALNRRTSATTNPFIYRIPARTAFGRNDEVPLNVEFFNRLLAFVIPDARSLREPESMRSLLKNCIIQTNKCR
jgi:hypothetical protein